MPTLRRISQEFSYRAPNALWNLLEGFFESLTEPTELRHTPADAINHLYTADRLSPYDPEATRHLVSRVQSVFPGIDGNRLGHTEADVLAWLGHSTTIRVLNLVGSRGVGKSSLVYYLLRGLWAHSEAMHRLWPLIVDLRSIPDDAEPEHFLHAFSIASADLSNQLAAIDVELTPPAFAPGGAGDIRTTVVRQLLDLAKTADSKGATLIIALDNVDQLMPSSIAQLLTIARATTLADSSARVLLSMRPFSQRTQMVRNAHLSGFITASCTVRPADVARIITARALYYRRQFSHPGLHTIVGTDDPASVVRAVVGAFLPLSVRQVLTTQMCNNNMRRALLAVRSFLKSRVLPIDTLRTFIGKPLHDAEEHTRVQQRSRTLPYQLLKGIMVEDRLFYTDPATHERPVVLNLFHLGGEPNMPRHLLQPRLLALLRLYPLGVSRTEAIQFCQSLGYTPRDFESAVERLLITGLIESPEHDQKAAHVDRMYLTATGGYYLDSLIQDDEYLFNAVADIPLQHESWPKTAGPELREEPGTEYRLVVVSLMELLDRILDDESAQIERALQTDDAVRAAAYVALPCFSAALAEGIKRLLSHGHGGNPVIRRTAQERQNVFDHRYAPHVLKLGERLSEARKSMRRTTDQGEARVRLSNDAIALVRYPIAIDPKHIEAVELKLEDDELLGDRQVCAFLSLANGVVEGGHEMSSLIDLGSRPGSRSGRWLVSARKRATAPRGSIFFVCEGIPIGRVTLGSDKPEEQFA